MPEGWIGVLGPVIATRNGATVALRGVSARTVLARLVVAGGRSVSADELVAALWDAEPGRPQATIQAAVSRLRAGLGREAIVTEPGGYRLDAELVSSDLAEVEAILLEAERLAESGQDAADVAARLDAALDRWRGEPLADAASTLAMAPQRARLLELRSTLTEQRLAAHLDAGRALEILPDLRLHAASEPERETAQRLLMRGLGDLGRTAEALRVAAAHRRLLTERSGLDPSPAFVALERALLDGTPAPAGPADSRRARGAPHRRRAWTPPDDELVGRQDALDEAGELLAARRLLTVLGPGGIGKTRLAMELASRWDDGEVAVLELAPLDEDADLAVALAGELGLQAPGGDLVAALGERLDLFGGLLVLDNAEHVLAAARDLAEQLLRRAPTLRLLVTSRRRLDLSDEQVLVLEPLPGAAAPSPDEPAVRLFLDRAARSAPGFRPDQQALEHIAAITHLVDGIPLALELAARRVALLDPAELHRRIVDGMEVLSLQGTEDTRRHATVEATISWSLDLLAPATLAVFDELAIFPDRFDVTAAEAVVGSGDALAALAELVDSSLLVVEAAPAGRRFRMLEPIRRVGRRRLDASGRARDAAASHAAWATGIGDRMEQLWMSDDEATAIELLVQHRADLLTAITHLAAQDRQENVDRLARQIGLILIQHPDTGFATIIPAVTGRTVDGAVARALIGSSVGRPTQSEIEDLRAALSELTDADPRRHHLRYAFVPAQMYQGDIDGAVATCRQLVTDPETPVRFQVLAASTWALATCFTGTVDAAEAVLRDHVELLGRTPLAGWVAYVRAEVASASDVDTALEHLEEAIGLAQRSQADFVDAAARVLRLSLLVHSGRRAEAWDLSRELVPWLLATGVMPQAWRALRATAHLFVAAGEHRMAARIFAAGEHDPRAPIVLDGWVGTIERQWELIRTAIGEEEVARIRATSSSVPVGQLWAEAEQAMPDLDRR